MEKNRLEQLEKFIKTNWGTHCPPLFNSKVTLIEIQDEGLYYDFDIITVLITIEDRDPQNPEKAPEIIQRLEAIIDTKKSFKTKITFDRERQTYNQRKADGN